MNAVLLPMECLLPMGLLEGDIETIDLSSKEISARLKAQRLTKKEVDTLPSTGLPSRSNQSILYEKVAKTKSKEVYGSGMKTKTSKKMYTF